jgi:N-acyl-D-aspartate/D-glutamate deacylase
MAPGSAIGYKAIVVNGQVTFESGECTGATPGKLLRTDEQAEDTRALARPI